MASVPSGAVKWSNAFAGSCKYRFLRQDVVELALIVENYLRLRHRSQSFGDLRVVPQISQQSIADAAISNRAKLFLDRLQYLSDTVIRSHFQQDREDSRKPSDGPR